MASTYSNLKIQLMTTGENTGTWGNVTNTNLGTAIEEAITGSVDVTFASGDVTLTLTNTNATQSARNLRLNCTGTTGGARNLILGSGCQIEKVYIVNNGCADAITIKNTTGNGIAVPAGKTMYVFNNGTNVVDAITHLTSLTLASALPVTSGGTGATTLNGLAFTGENITNLNASSISSGTIANARTTAASANGASTIVARDASGNFSANTITSDLIGNLTGTASNATVLQTARTIAIQDGVTGTATSFNGSANISIPVTGINASFIDTGTISNARTTASSGNGASTIVARDASGYFSTNAIAVNTISGTLNGNASTASSATQASFSTTQSVGNNTTAIATTAFVQAALQTLYPVGSIYTNANNNTNPGTLLGFGTWTAFGAGRVMVGFDISNSLFDSPEETGGSADAIVVSHTHTATSTVTDPGHTHTYVGSNFINAGTSSGGSAQNIQTRTTDSAVTGVTVATTVASSGSSGTNANIQPYITVYMWKRTA